MVNLKLLAARKERRWSIEVASAQVGVSRITYSRWENGHQEPQPTVLQWLCEAFEKSAEDLGYGHLSKKSVRAEGTTRLTPNTNQNFSMLTENQLAAFKTLIQLGETTLFDPKRRETLQTVLTIINMVLVKPQKLLQIETTDFTVATAADIPACITLNRELYTIISNEENATLTEKWIKWLEKNPEIVYVLKKNKEVIGIATMLPFKPDSEKFKETLRGDTSILLGNTNISSEDIEEYKAGNHIQLYIAEIGIKPGLDKDLRRKYGAKLISKFIDTIVDLGKKGVIIESIIAVGATRSGIRLLQHFGFNEIIFPRADTRLFTITIKESGVPLVLQYKQALAEYQEATRIIEQNGRSRKRDKDNTTSATNELQTTQTR